MKHNTIIFLAVALVACGAASAATPPALYGAGLKECNRTSKTCEESIDCENKLRASAGRPLRAQDGCK